MALPNLIIMFLFLFFAPLLLLLLKENKTRRRRRRRLPPSPPKFPIIGNLHQLGFLPHRSLRTLSNTHGPLMLLHLGQIPTLIISSAETAKEITRTHDLVFASRPSLKAIRLLFRGQNDLVFAPYGDYWRRARKLCVTHLLSAKMVESFKWVREEEVGLMIANIGKVIGSVVNMSEVLNSFMCDLVCKVVLGKFLGRNEMLREMVEENSFVAGEFHPSDCFPGILGWLDGVLLGARQLNARAKRNAERWDDVLEEVIRSHDDDDGEEKKGSDFVDVLLSLQKKSDGEFFLEKGDIKALLLDIFAAGIDTSFIVLEWSLAELIRNPKLMKKLQDEVSSLIGEKEMVREEDLSKMSYLKAVIKETLRLHPPASLLVPRESMEDCVVEGYEIPKKTRVLINAWAIGRDPKFWEEPDEFRPERFIDNPVDFRGSDFQFIPFGAGRRICPGMNFAVSTVELALANLAHRFDWELPCGMTSDDLDMADAPGFLTHRKQRLHLVAKLRSSF